MVDAQTMNVCLPDFHMFNVEMAVENLKEVEKQKRGAGIGKDYGRKQGEKMKKYMIYKRIGNLSQPNNGWTKELNFISWDDREPVYDIRTWNETHTEYGKGVTLTAGQMSVLKELVHDIQMF